MRSERITFRLNNEMKKKLELLSLKEKKTLSQFICDSLREKIENDGLTDSQGQFLKLFDIAFKKSYDSYHKQEMVVLNRNNFNTQWLLEIMDLFMKHLKVPQTKDEVKTSFTSHPISEIAHDKVLKNIRNQSAKKKEKDENEFE